MKLSFARTREVLERTPLVLTALLGGISEDWASHPYGEGTWSAHDVLAHLIHGERTDWIPRARIILEHGAAKPFEPFDRQGYVAEAREKPLDTLLAEFARCREESLAALDRLALTESLLDTPGMHPKLGPVTLRNLLSTWVVHDLNHVAQISKALAFQYSTEVGPWRQYLSILAPPSPR
jgi:uncharacterized damage-inducible protein DinB